MIKAIIATNKAGVDALEGTETVVNINIKTAVPVVYLDQRLGDGPVTTETGDVNAVEYNIGIKSEVFDIGTLDANGYLARYEESDEGHRFVLKAVVKSISTKHKAFIYYDNETKQLLIMPELTVYTSPIFKNKTVTIEAVTISNQAERFVTTNRLELDFADNGISIPEPIEVTKTKTHYINLPGFDEYSVYNNSGFQVDGERYLESGLNAPVQMISLGSFFEDNVAVLPIVPNSFKSHTISQGNRVVPLDVLLPLEF